MHAATRLGGIVTAAIAAVIATGATAIAEPVVAVVRHAGGDDDLPVARLRNQLVDLDVTIVASEGPLEAQLDDQIAAAPRLASDHDAVAVVWFDAHRNGMTVVVATPRDNRVFVRQIAAGDASATAEAAALAARSALRAISLGGTIGVEVPTEVVTPPFEPPPPPLPSPQLRWNGALGWQAAIDNGADVGAHAAWERIGVARGRWGASVESSLGPPLRRVGDVTVELVRISAFALAEHRRGPLRFALGAGAVVYDRATVAVPGNLAPTAPQISVGPAATAQVRAVWHPAGGAWGLEATVAVDVVGGAPALAVESGGMVTTFAKLATLQPRFALGLVIGP